MNNTTLHLDPNDERFVNNPDYYFDDLNGLGWVKDEPVVIPEHEPVVMYFYKTECLAKVYGPSEIYRPFDQRYSLQYRRATEDMLKSDCEARKMPREEYEKYVYGPFTISYYEVCHMACSEHLQCWESEADYLNFIDHLKNGGTFENATGMFARRYDEC